MATFPAGSFLRSNVSTDLGYGASAMTVIFWHEIPTGTDNGTGIYANYGPMTLRGQSGGATNCQVRWNHSGGNVSLNSGAIGADALTMISCSYANGSQALYLNGNETPVATNTIANDLNTGSAAFWTIGDTSGAASGPVQFAGACAIIGKALSASEIAAIYNGTAKPEDHHNGTTVIVKGWGLNAPASGNVTNGDAGLAAIVNGDTFVLQTNTGTPTWDGLDPHDWGESATPILETHRITNQLARTFKNGNFVLIIKHDSFGVMIPGRLPYAWLLTQSRNVLRGATLGHWSANANAPMRTYDEATGTTFEADGGSDYLMQGGAFYNGVPVKNVYGWRYDNDLVLGANNQYCEYRIRASRIGTSGFANFPPTGAKIRARLVLLGADSHANQVRTVVLRDVNSSNQVIADLLVDGCRPMIEDATLPTGGEPITPEHFASTADEIELTISGGEARLSIRAFGDEDPEEQRWLMVAGISFYCIDENGNRIGGVQFQPYGDDSWSHSGHTVNAASTGNKRYTRDQIRRHLSATCVDPSLQPIYLICLADEGLSESEHEDQMLDYITAANAECSGIYAKVPQVFYINHHAHTIDGGAETADDVKEHQRNAVRASMTVANSQPTFSYASIFLAMEENYPTTDVKANGTVQAAFTAWAEARGWDEYTWGLAGGPQDNSLDLLDTPGGGRGLHPANEGAASALASLLDEMIEEAIDDLPAPTVSVSRSGVTLIAMGVI